MTRKAAMTNRVAAAAITAAGDVAGFLALTVIIFAIVVSACSVPAPF
jgi:hypothetical protein